MNLKEAKQNNKLSQFIKEREKKTPANRKRFNRLVNSMASRKPSPKRGT